ncbi:MAG: helix-turn-helix domain-containing protein [Actinomycetota bacterium]
MQVADRDELFMTPTEAADRLRVSKMTVYRLIHGGHLPAVQIGKAFRIRSADLDTYLESCTVRVDSANGVV